MDQTELVIYGGPQFEQAAGDLPTGAVGQLVHRFVAWIR
jgi:hypothetical protein